MLKYFKWDKYKKTLKEDAQHINSYYIGSVITSSGMLPYFTRGGINWDMSVALIIGYGFVLLPHIEVHFFRTAKHKRLVLLSMLLNSFFALVAHNVGPPITRVQFPNYLFQLNIFDGLAIFCGLVTVGVMAHSVYTGRYIIDGENS